MDSTNATSPSTELTITPTQPARLCWHSLILLVFACATCLALLSRGPSMGDHECINAVAARQAIENGHLLIPYVNDAPWVRKPPLGTWLIAAAARVWEAGQDIPVSDFTARLPSALAGVVNALVVAWLGAMLFGRRIGWVAGVIAAGAVGSIFFSRNAQVDMPMTAMVTLSFACFWRGAMHERPAGWAMIGFYVALSLAMLAKAPLPLAIVGGTLFIYWFFVWDRRAGASADAADGRPGLREAFRCLLKLRLATGTIVFLVLFGAWPLYVYFTVPGALDLWRTEYLDRASGEMSDSDNGPFYYLLMLFGLVAPYTFSLLEALAAPFVSWYRPHRKGLRFVLTWAVFGTVFLSAMAFKRPHYLLPVLPAFFLLLAPVIDRLFFGEVGLLVPRLWVQRLAMIIPIAIIAVAVVAGFVVHRQFPAVIRDYVVMISAGGIIWSASAVAYARGHRPSSFVLLNLGVVAATLVGWPAIGKHLQATPQAVALAAEMKRLGITDREEIIWVGKRPKATLEFYAHLSAKRLIGDLELAQMRRGREEVSEEIFAEYGRRMQEQLAQSRPVYLIMESGYYYMFERATGLKAKVLIELHGYNDEPGEDLIVVTQAWNLRSPTSSAPADAASVGPGRLTALACAPVASSSPAWHPDRSAPRNGPHFTCHENNAQQDQRNPRPLTN